MNKQSPVDPRKYPMLWRIMWDRRHLQHISPEDALELYEYRWDYTSPEDIFDNRSLYNKDIIEIGMILANNESTDIFDQAMKISGTIDSNRSINESFLKVSELLQIIDLQNNTKKALRINDITFQRILLAIFRKKEEIEAGTYFH